MVNLIIGGYMITAEHIETYEPPTQVIDGHEVMDSIYDEYACFFVIKDGMYRSAAELFQITDGVWEFSRLITHRKCRKQGIAKAIIKRLMQFCEDEKINLVTWVAPYADEEAMKFEDLRRFYIKQGFQETKYPDKVILVCGDGDFSNFI